MERLLKVFVPALASALISACAVSPAPDMAGASVQPRVLAAQPAAHKSAEIPAQPSQADQEGVRKVALSLASMSDPNSTAYKIGPRNSLEVTVFKAPELSKALQVSEAGTINFPLIGELIVSGKTAREVEQEMAKKLGSKYLQDPQISVLVKEYFSQRITMEGAVRRPGVYPMAGGLSLLQAMALAGGFDESASHTVVLFRQVEGKRMAAQYDVASMREGSAEDAQLQAGDVIIVPTSDLKQGFNYMMRLLPLATFVPMAAGL